MSRPILAQLDLQALKDNLQIVRRAAPGSRVWSVVKANAYGHGIDRIWSALGGTDGFALLNLEEAILLRERGWKGPILLLEGFFHAQDLPLLDKYRLTTSVHSNWQIKAIQDAKLHAPLDIYLKVNSGMNRLGFQPERVHTVWQQLRALKNVGEMTLRKSRTALPMPWSALSRRQKVWTVRARCRTQRQRSGIPRRTTTGCVQGSFCTARHPQVSGRILPTAA